MLQKFGADVVNDLESREHESKKWTREELNDIRVYYRAKLADLHNGIAPECGNQSLSMSALWTDLPQPDSVSLLSMLDPAVSTGDKPRR